MKFVSRPISFSLVQLPDPSQDFFPISRLGGNPVRTIMSKSYFMEDSPKKKNQIGGSCFEEMKL